jgi:2-methylaconitate cis-trans-isomerase PrpF
MAQTRIPAVFMRGGTSNAIVFHRKDLPVAEADWPKVMLSAMGSPDPNGRQLNGMGGGISSLSKVCVVGPPSREDADIDYTFFQIGVTDDTVDTSGNCGNMSSAMGPFALEEGLVPAPAASEAVVRIHNTNTRKVIRAVFPTKNGTACVEGDFILDGVAGSGAPIRLEFLDPGGAGTGRLLPTGRALDSLDVPGLGPVEVTMIDAANPCVFVAAQSLGLTGAELPDAIEADALCLQRLESIRRAASVAMGIAGSEAEAAAIPSIPKVAMISPPQTAPTLSGRTLAPEDFDIGVRMISIGRPHRAVPLTGGICLAVAVRTPGSLPHRLARVAPGAIRVGQPSGVLQVDADVAAGDDGTIVARHGAVYRTARRMFEGHVLIPG